MCSDGFTSLQQAAYNYANSDTGDSGDADPKDHLSPLNRPLCNKGRAQVVVTQAHIP